MWSGQWPGPEHAGSGRAWASNITIVLRAGPGLDILFAGLIIQFAGRARAGSAQLQYSAAVIEGFKRNSAIYVGDSIVRKTDSRLNKGEDVVVCLPGARIEHVTARVEKIMGRGKGGTILVHIGTNNADKEGTTAIVDKYSKLLKKTKEARVGQIILSGILPCSVW